MLNFGNVIESAGPHRYAFDHVPRKLEVLEHVQRRADIYYVGEAEGATCGNCHSPHNAVAPSNRRSWTVRNAIVFSLRSANNIDASQQRLDRPFDKLCIN